AGDVSILGREEDELYWKLIRHSFPVGIFPYRGASICWLRSEIPAGDDPVASELAWVGKFLAEVSRTVRLRPDDRLVLLWDDPDYRTLVLSLALLERYVDDLRSISSHMYVLPPECNWAMCFRIEGDMGFGYRPD